MIKPYRIVGRLVSIILLGIFLTGCATLVPYTSSNQMNLHERLSIKKTKVAVLPFTLKTSLEEKKVGFENADVDLTNTFLEVIWKKNKVKIAHNNEVLAAIKNADLTYSEMNPEMADLLVKPNLEKLFKMGEDMGVNVVFLGTVRKNSYHYVGGMCFLAPSIMAKKRVYNVGAQMMALDIDKREVLAFDYINNALAIPTKLFAITGKVSNKSLAKGQNVLLQKCGFALAYYAPMPEMRTDTKILGLATAAALLNAFAGTQFSVDASITDETWKMYPAGYFTENYGYTRTDVAGIAR